jgi:hypothetical protein
MLLFLFKNWLTVWRACCLPKGRKFILSKGLGWLCLVSLIVHEHKLECCAAQLERTLHGEAGTRPPVLTHSKQNRKGSLMLYVEETGPYKKLHFREWNGVCALQ